MVFSSIGDFTARLADAGSVFAGNLSGVFLAPGSQFSILSIASALVIAALLLIIKRRRPVRLKVLIRALFPKRILLGETTRADITLMAFTPLAAGMLFGWAMLSYHVVGGAVTSGLERVFGALTPASIPQGACVAIMTVALYLAYEFAYWFYHYLSHRIPFLWAFHRVHHTAEALSPLTNFRVHPIDSLVFGNAVALVTGVVGGALVWIFGRPVNPFVLNGTNLILVGFMFCLVHLQHSHIWIAFRGPLGKIILSPAHHQLHHSENPEHFGRNFGSCLSVWDWMFGTLLLPTARPQKLVFGAARAYEKPHSLKESLITPFADSILGVDMGVPQPA